eukprot:gene8700-8512_t
MNDLNPWGQRRDFLKAMAAVTGSLPVWAQAQSSWPSKPVTMVVPFPAGGGTDAFARPLSAQFAKLTGKQLIIDNRGGAGGTLGAGVAAKSAPDGYNLFMGAVHHTIAPSMYPKLDYDLERDLIPLILVANVPQVLVVNPKKVQAADFKAFLEMGTPADAQARAIEEIRRACQTDEAKAVWANQGAEFPNLTTAQFDGFIKKELTKWAQVVKASGAKLD